MTLSLAREAPRRARRELVVTWIACVAVIGAARALGLVDPTGLLAGNIAGVAAFVFIAFPERLIHAHGERWTAYGLEWWGLTHRATWRAWARGAGLAVAVCAVVFPVFFAGFWLYGAALPHLPTWLSTHLAPYALPPIPRFQLPRRFGLFALVQLLVVALPEELFYRGWMQTTWAASDRGRRIRILGASLGAGFVWTQVLFAVGHLVVLQAWRLGTFLPGLLFGWARERSGGLAAPVVLHTLSNLFIAVLEASFYG